MKRVLIVLSLAASVPLVTPTDTQATQSGTNVIKSWHTMDNCAREAQTAFPDYTPESNAKRDAKLKECLAARNLPPRAPQQ